MGYFAPEYKFLAEAYTAVLEFLAPVKKRSSRTEGKIITQSGGEVDFWTLDNDKAGLGRRYHLVVIDEAASTLARFLYHDSSVRISWISGKWVGRCSETASAMEDSPQNSSNRRYATCR